MSIARKRVHLSRCDYCGRKIAWSRDRRHWLSLAPRTELPGKPIHRRMHCAAGPGLYHDPGFNIFDRAFSLLAGVR